MFEGEGETGLEDNLANVGFKEEIVSTMTPNFVNVSSAESEKYPQLIETDRDVLADESTKEVSEHIEGAGHDDLESLPAELTQRIVIDDQQGSDAEGVSIPVDTERSESPPLRTPVLGDDARPGPG